MSECQIPNGCIYDEKAHACPLCDEHGVDDIARFYTDHPEAMDDSEEVPAPSGQKP
jgi:hypothetical protein